MENQIYSPMMSVAPQTVKTNRICGMILMMLKITCVLVLTGLMSFYVYGQVSEIGSPSVTTTLNSTKVKNYIDKKLEEKFNVLHQLIEKSHEKQHRNVEHENNTTTITTTPSTTTTANATNIIDYDNEFI